MAEVDVHEAPPVPPEDPGADERIGWWATGALCLLVGWAGAVVGNVLAHVLAPSGGWSFYGLWIGRTMGPYAWAVLGIGLAVGAYGIVLFHLARHSPRGRFVLPGYSY
jgi:hypothetical protein